MPARFLPSQAPRRSLEPRRPRRRRRRAATRLALPSAPSRPRRDPAPSCVAPRAGLREGGFGRRAPGHRISSRHGPKRTRPSSRTVSYSRTPRIPAPRSADFVPARRGEQLRKRPFECPRQAGTLLGERQEVPVGARMQAPEEREDLVADQATLRVRVGGIGAEGQAVLSAVRLRLLPPEREQRTDDAVLARRPDALAVAGRDEPIEDRLDLIRGRVAGRPQATPLGQRIAEMLAAPPRSSLVTAVSLGVRAPPRP